jgi:hypothetical protein
LQAKITKMSISTNSNNWHYVLVFIRLEYNDFNFSLTNARQHGRPSPVFTRTARITGVKSRTSISLRHNFYSHFKIINFLVGVKGVVRGTAPAFAPLLDRTRIRAQPSSSALWSASHVPASRLHDGLIRWLHGVRGRDPTSALLGRHGVGSRCVDVGRRLAFEAGWLPLRWVGGEEGLLTVSNGGIRARPKTQNSWKVPLLRSHER